MKRIALLALTGVVFSMGVGCGGPQDPEIKMTKGPLGPKLKGPRDGVFLRASFDDDPSHFIGRFISNDVPNDKIDENRGIQTECSKFVTYKAVNASGDYDEYYNSSTEVSANLGVENVVPGAPQGNGGVGHESGTSIRVKYEISKKLVANIEDPAEFKACCNAAPGNCTDRYIGEFWSGTGMLYEKSGSATEASMSGGGAAGATNIEGDASYADGWAWRKSTNLKNTFFAFRVIDRVANDDCGWATQLPKSNDGQFFVGMSPPSLTEDIARQMAMRNARAQVVSYMGESIKSESTNVSSAVDGYLKSENIVTSVAEGLASLVKDDRYCKAERVVSPDGELFKVKVLAFFPNAAKAEAKTATIDAVEKQMEVDGKLSPEAKKELESLKVK